MNKKTLAIILAALFLLFPVFTGCQDNNSGDDDDLLGGGEIGDPNLTEKDWDGEVFVVLTQMDRGEGQAFNIVDLVTDDKDDMSDPINKAVFERNEMIRTLFDAGIERIQEDNSSYSNIIANTLANGDSYSAYMMKIHGALNLALSGDLLDMNSEVGYINLQEDWWDTTTIESLEVNNRSYFALGDINTVDDDATWCVLFNKSLQKKYKNLPNFYDKVRDGEWTIENMKRWAQGSITDDSGDGTTDKWKLESKYQYGLYFQDECATVLLQASGVTPFTKNQKNSRLESNLGSIEMDNAITKIRENVMLNDAVNNQWALNINDIKTYNGGDIWKDIARGGFMANKALFFMCHCGTINLIRQMDADFGILPIPKVDDSQKEYGNTVQYGNATCYAIPYNTPNAEFSGFMLEALGYLSSREYSETDSLKAAYYETTLKRKATRDDDSWDMLDLVFDNRIFDISCARDTAGINGKIVDSTKNSNKAWATVVASYGEQIETEISEDLLRLWNGNGNLN